MPKAGQKTPVPKWKKQADWNEAFIRAIQVVVNYSLRQHRFQFRHKCRQLANNDAPYDFIVDNRISMNDLIAESNDTIPFADVVQRGRILSPQLRECLPDDSELSVYA